MNTWALWMVRFAAGFLAVFTCLAWIPAVHTSVNLYLVSHPIHLGQGVPILTNTTHNTSICAFRKMKQITKLRPANLCRKKNLHFERRKQMEFFFSNFFWVISQNLTDFKSFWIFPDNKKGKQCGATASTWNAWSWDGLQLRRLWLLCATFTIHQLQWQMQDLGENSLQGLDIHLH